MAKKKTEPKEIKVGHEVKDILSGVQGYVIATCQWLTGCDTVYVEPISKGEKKESISLDINRVQYIGEGVRPKFFPEEAEKNEEKPIKGGPHDKIKHPNKL